jgi:hypothetical protein
MEYMSYRTPEAAPLTLRFLHRLYAQPGPDGTEPDLAPFWAEEAQRLPEVLAQTLPPALLRALSVHLYFCTYSPQLGRYTKE